MKVLKFKLSGKSAFFKKPEVNSYFYFTYGHIHKIALIGMFGAILGYGGYNKHRYMLDNIKNYSEEYPQFYEKLISLKVSIEPLNERAYITKKVQVFNNSVGYASQENGGNLIVKEQWLENPKWNIYVLLDSEEAEHLSDYIINRKSVYQPYLGKNDHSADITDIKVLECEIISKNSINIIHSLCPKKYISFKLFNDEDYDIYKYSEKLPIALNKVTNMYQLEDFVFSNINLEILYLDNVYRIDEKNIIFF